jgi:transposase
MDWTACVGIDWADEAHAYTIVIRDGTRSSGSVSSRPEELHEWIRSLRVTFPSGNIVIGVEQGRASLLDALSRYEFLTIIPINPRASKAYRDARRLSGSSSDPVDADLICDFTIKHMDELRVWRPDEAITRRLRALTETRRQLVDQRSAHTQQLTAALKGYFPQLLAWISDVKPNVLWHFVRLWPTLAALQLAHVDHITRIMKAHRLHHVAQRVQKLIALLDKAVALVDDDAIIDTGALHAQALASLLEVLDVQITNFDKAIEHAWSTHPDHDVFSSLPGAGAVLAPRLAVAFGQDRSKYDSAFEVHCYSGIAPVTESSGKRKTVHARWQFPNFTHQTFHEFAASSLPHVRWANVSYRQHRDRGASHHAAIRSVAFQWIRILFRIWKDHEPYNDTVYNDALRRRNSPLAA